MLEGVRIVEFGYAWAGPLVGRTLGDLGADVIKVEQNTSRGGPVPEDPELRAALSNWQRGTLPEPTLRASVFPESNPGDEPWNRAGIFNKHNRNKRSLCADLKSEAGKRIWRRLVEASDVVVDNFSPRGSHSLGIDYESIREWNPRIISVSLTGYGHTGPFRQRVSYGPILEAHSGSVAATGYLGGGPMKLGHAFPDPVGGLHGAFAVLAALWERDRTGEGMFIDLSQLQSYTSLIGDLLLQTSIEGAPARRGNRGRGVAPQGVYPCLPESPDARGQLDMWLAITVDSDDAWAGLKRVIDDPRLDHPAFETFIGRDRAHDQIDAVITEWTSSRNRFESAAALQAVGVAAAPAMTNADLIQSAQLRERGFVVEWDQPGVGVYEYGGFPIHFSDEETPEMRPAPGLGADNRAILEELGFDQDEINRFMADGTLVDAPPTGGGR